MHQNYLPLLNTARGDRHAATPMAFIRAIILAYERYGMDPRNALSLALIAPERLENYDDRVTAAQLEMMSAIAMQELDDEALGWFSRKLPWGTYGMLCRASLTSPNLRIALSRWCRHHRLLTNDIVLRLATAGLEATVSIEPNRDLGKMQELCLVTSLRYVLGFACWAIDSRITLVRTHFPYAAPQHQDVYRLMFPGPVVFNSDRTSISFDAQYLDLQLLRDESNLQQMLCRALSLTILQYRRDRLLKQRVRQLLQTRPNKFCTAESIARQLNVSTRTLHRHLREEGSSLMNLKDDTRRDRAIHLLSRTQRSIKYIALATGYLNEKSFGRAFKQWTGEPPGSYRDRINENSRGGS